MGTPTNSNNTIILGFGAIILILALMTSANVYIVSENNKTISIIELEKKHAKDTLIMANSARQRALYLFEMSLIKDAFDRDDIFVAYNDEALNLMIAFNRLRERAYNEGRKGQWDEVLKVLQKARLVQNKVADLIYTEAMDEANKLLFKKIIPTQKQVYSILTKRNEEKEQIINHEISNIRKLNLRAYWLVSIFGITAILLSIGIAAFVSLHNKKSKLLEIEKQLAEDANDAKTEFLSNMSHELRTPLHAILSYSTFGITKRSASRDKIESYFTRIYVSGERLLNLVTSLLDIAKLESGKIEYNFSTVNLDKNLKECLDEVSGILESKNLRVELNIPTDLRHVYCDETLMYQVFQNLISNAIKFSNDDSIIVLELKNKVILNKKKIKIEGIRFSIEDSGVGIGTDELEMVFDKFIQSSLTKTGSGGTGLGLAICSEIITGHAGKIWAECDEGKGARFVFEIPAVQDTSEKSVDA